MEVDGTLLYLFVSFVIFINVKNYVNKIDCPGRNLLDCNFA